MAQAKRKRRTKHRGTQAGTIEARGRTSRPRSRAEARQQTIQRRQAIRAERAARPPSWRSATMRAALMAVVFLVAMVAIMHQPPVSSVMISLLMFGLYIPMGFFLDQFLFTLRQKREAAQRAQAAAQNGNGDHT